MRVSAKFEPSRYPLLASPLHFAQQKLRVFTPPQLGGHQLSRTHGTPRKRGGPGPSTWIGSVQTRPRLPSQPGPFTATTVERRGVERGDVGVGETADDQVDLAHAPPPGPEHPSAPSATPERRSGRPRHPPPRLFLVARPWCCSSLK
jgi:hypothetical protein